MTLLDAIFNAALGRIDLITVPELEGAKRRWQMLDERTCAVAPSLLEEIKKHVAEVQHPEAKQ